MDSSQEYRDGRKARGQGRLISDCPYDVMGNRFERAKADDWCNGWMDRDYEFFDQDVQWREEIEQAERFNTNNYLFDVFG